jgi:putative transcriptional regulator
VKQGVKNPDLQYLRIGGADVWMFMGITLLVIVQIFKKGIEIQNENDLTVLAMPIVVNLDVMMAKWKMSLNELSGKVDLTLSNLSILKTGQVKAIRFTNLEAIYNVLDYQPGDILEYREIYGKNKPIT